jgi:hypothetical protein
VEAASGKKLEQTFALGRAAAAGQFFGLLGKAAIGFAIWLIVAFAVFL